jgi:hypothetical protein
MFSKKFSLDTAYTQGASVVFNHFMFFLVAIIVGGLVAGAALVVLGVLDFYALRHHIAPLLKLFHHVSNSATGAVHYGGATVQEAVRPYLTPEIAAQTLGRDMISVDVKSYDQTYLVSVLLPTMLVLKLVADMISIGWTKIALDFNSKSTASLNYLFKYYYLVPRVFVINLIVGVLTILGCMLFVVPGIFIYQRLRFAKYFVIDKNLSIAKAFNASWALTEGAVVALFGFTIVSVLVEALGQVLVVLYLFTSPLQNQVDANVYRQMLDNK